jgi:hypothetical protein
VAERLRALLEHPLDPRLARAIVVLACAVSGGFAALVVLAGAESAERPSASETPPAGAARRVATEPTELPARSQPRTSEIQEIRPAQDPQDRYGSAAARRADRELADHRALQHVPYRRRGVAIALVGARGERAVLRVSAPTLEAARRDWRAFLRRFHDPGSAYVARFEARGGASG